MKNISKCWKIFEVKAGEYGARQVLSMETNGPFSHVLDV